MNSLNANHRSSIIDLLELLSSPEHQLDYQSRVRGINVCDELVCMWFDDSYVPESPAFRQSFSAEELKSSEEFNVYFDVNEKLLPQQPSSISDWLENEHWQRVMREAGRALRGMHPGTH